MKRPSVFVSSTCYDLKQVRTDIKLSLENLGLEPVLSDFDTFPVNPELGTLENCLKAVQNKADIFVLIVGARYGSVVDQGRSITNLEFMTAQAKGIPAYVFVMRAMLEILKVWEKNPDGDFTNVADSPKLFEFVSSLRQTGDTWVFPFDTAQDIFGVLQTQLAYLFMDALELRLRTRQSTELSTSLADLQGPALRYVIERPYAWEYLLFGQILQDELDALGDIKKDWRYGIATGVGQKLGSLQLFNWIGTKIPEGLRIVENLKSLLEEALPNALGPPGTSGDPSGIVYVARRVATLYRNALEWKLDFRRVAADDELVKVKSLASNICDTVVNEIERWSCEYNAAVPKAIAAARAGKKTELTLTLRPTSPDLTEFTAEVDSIKRKVNSGDFLS